jgi:RHS repeat-associated protein
MTIARDFTGKERDAETGLDYFGARYMSSAQGRFSSPDSHMGAPGNPQSWNKYAYTFNNPLALVDPDGHFPTPAHIQWTAAGLQSLGFSNAQAFATVVNSTVDRKFFSTDYLHAMSGDSAYQGGRWGLLSIAANSRNPAESAVALVMGMHLVEDYAGHQGITSMIGHILKYGFGDTDPNSQAGKTAQGNTQKFLDDFMNLLIANLGEAGAQEYILKMQTNAERLTRQADLAKKSPSLVYDYIKSIYDQMVFPQTRVNGQAPISHAEEEAQRQCALGNPAACVQ